MVSGSSERACPLFPGRRFLESGRVETGALSKEVFAIDTLGQAVDVPRAYTNLGEVRLPSVNNLDYGGNFGRGFGGEQAEGGALRHGIVERRIAAMAAADELLEALPRIAR